MQVSGAYVGIAGAHISSTNSRGVSGVGHHGRGVTQDDIDRAMEAAEAIAVPASREIVHALPRHFTLDGQDGIREPVGMMGFRLEVEAHVVTAASASIQNLVKAVSDAQVNVLSLVLEPLAAGEAVLQSSEKEMGVALVDIGGGTTGVAVYSEGSACHSIVLPIGGMHVTNDMAVVLYAPFEAAEEIKLKFGHVNPNEVRSEEYVDVDAFGDETERAVSRRDIAEIIHARAEEMLTMVANEIIRSGHAGLLPAGIVLTGGTAQLAGLRQMAREMLHAPVRIGTPQGLEGLADKLHGSAFATGVGLVKWGLLRETELAAEAIRKSPKTRQNGKQGQTPDWLKVVKSVVRVFTP
jgi:cell division protein FtsA